MGSGALERTAVCVLGMSRSGTSLTARVLGLAGVYLGREEDLLQKDLRQLASEGEAVLARARATNPEGFWEHYRLMRLNERILRALGGNWREPPRLPPGWETSNDLSAELEEARAILERSFSGHELWGWKDPRNCLTLPFWQRLLPELRYVICLRNPIDVALSLQRRDGIPVERGVELWLTYLSAALVNTAGKARTLVPYEAYFEQPEALASRLARFVGRDGAFESRRAGQELADAIDERLWRHRTATMANGSDERIPAAVTALRASLESAASEAPEPKGARGKRLHAALDEAAQRLYAGRLSG